MMEVNIFYLESINTIFERNCFGNMLKVSVVTTVIENQAITSQENFISIETRITNLYYDNITPSQLEYLAIYYLSILFVPCGT